MKPCIYSGYILGPKTDRTLMGILPIDVMWKKEGK